MFTDKRAKLLSEMLTNIRLIKMFAWESYIEQSMQTLRDGELRFIRKVISVNAIVVTFMSAVPGLAFMLTMVVYILVEKRIDPGLAFSSLALFNAFRMPLGFLPYMIHSMVKGLISIGASEPSSLPMSSTGCRRSIGMHPTLSKSPVDTSNGMAHHTRG